MPDMNKVEVSFTADVTSFNRGVDRMERKLDEFDKNSEKEINNVNRRFDLLDGSVKKVEKSMNGFGDNVDMRRVQEQLNKTKQEFESTGKVGRGAMIGLQNVIKNVDFDALDSKSRKAFATVQKDAAKLVTQMDKFRNIKYADGFQNENKVIAYSFTQLNDALRNSSLAFSNVRKGMKPEEAQKYSASMANVRRTLEGVRSELNTTGTISRDTFFKMKKDVESVNFDKLPLSARKAIKDVSIAFTGMNKTMDNTGTHISRNEERMRTFSRRTKGFIDANVNDFKRFIYNINRIGTAFRNVGEVSAGAFKGMIISSLTSVIPAAGSATTAIMGIGAGLGTVAGGAIGVGGALGIAGIAAKAFAGQATYALQMLEDGTLRITREVQNYKSALDGLKGDWEGLIKQNQAAIFNTMTNGINTARFALGALNPFLVKTASQIEQASSKMYKWVTSSQNAKNAFAMLNKIGPSIFQNILNSAGHVGNGVTRIFTAFGPLFTWTGQQLEKLSKKFDIWANSSNTQRGIASFINYTKENLPTVMSVFNNTFLGIINLFKAFSGQTSWALKGLNNLTERFKNWSATLDQTEGFKNFIAYTRSNAPVVGQLIGNIVNALVAFISAAAPIGAVVLRIVTAFTGWIAKMLQAHPAIAKMLAVMLTLVGVFKMSAIAVGLLYAPIGRLISMLGLLIGKQRMELIMQKLFNSSSVKSKGIIGMLQAAYSGLIARIKALAIQERLAAIQTRLANAIKAAGAAIANTYRYAIAALTTSQTLNAVKTKAAAAATVVWSTAMKAAALAARGLGLAMRFMTGPIGIIITIIGLLIGLFVHLWKTNSGFRNAVISIWNSIKQAAINVFGWLQPYITNIWNFIKTASINTWNFIKNAALAVWSGIAFAIQHPIQALQNVLSAIWNAIKFVAVGAWNGIKNAVLWIVNAYVAQVKANFNKLTSFFSWLWSGIKNISVSVWNAIKSAVLWIVNAYVSQVKANFQAMSSFFSWLWNGVKNISVNTWNAIKNAVLWIVNAYIAAVKRNFQLLSTFFSWLWTSIKNISVNVWNAIKAAVLWIINAWIASIKFSFQNLSTFFNWLWTGIKNISVSVWNAIKSAVLWIINAWIASIKFSFRALSTFFSALWTGIKNVSVALWNAIKSAVMFVVNNWIASIKFSFRVLSTFFTGLWTGIKNVAIAIWNAIKSAVMFVINTWVASIKFSFRALSAFFTNLWTGIKNVAVAIWNAIKNAVLFVIRSWIASQKAMFNGLRTFFTNLWTGIKNTAVAIWNAIRGAVMAIVRSFVSIMKSVIGTLRTFFINTWNVIKSVSIAVWNAIKNAVISAVRTLSSVTRSVIGTLRTWIVNAWNFIKSKVVAAALAIYRGVRSAFVNLSSAVTSIISKVRTWLVNAWNYIRSKVVSLAVSLYRGVRSAFTSVLSAVTNIISRLRSWLVNAWNYIRNKIVSLVRSMYNSIKSIFTSVWKFTAYIFGKLRSWLISTWNSIRNTVVSLVSKMWGGIRNTFNNLWNGTRNIFAKVKSFIVNTWQKIKDTVVGIVSKMWGGISSTFNNMKNGLSKIIDKIKGIFSTLTSSVKKAINALIKGVNWVAGKIGMDKLPYLSSGTATQTVNQRVRTTSDGRLKQDTMAVVGDKGVGNGPGGFRHETITYPNGRQVITPATDTVAYLPKHSRVDSGAQTYANMNSLPHFKKGTSLWGKIKNTASNAWEGTKKLGGKVVNGVNDKVQSASHKVAEKAGQVYAGTKEVVGSALDKAGDLMEYASHPEKLVDKVISAFGFNFDFMKGDLLKPMFQAITKKMKAALKNLFGGWLEEGGGADLSSFEKYGKVTPYSPNAPVPGYPTGFNGGRHYGIDYGTPSGTPLKAPTAGTVSEMHDHGGGLVAKLLSGGFTQFFLHLSSIVKKGKVAQGDVFAKSGNSGAWTTGPHLHYQVEKGNSPYITNRNTIDPEKFASMGGGGKSGGKRAPSAWRSEIVRAAKQMKVSPSKAQIDGIIAQIQRESGGDAGITQGNIGDINNLRGTPAQGILQYVPSTFAAYAVKGHKNIKSAYDQFLAFFNNSNWANDIQYGRSGWGPRGARRFATGGIVNSETLAWLADGGFSESIISHDPANRVKSKAIYDRTGEMLGFNDDTEILRRVEALLAENTAYQRSIDDNTRRAADKSSIIEMNSRQVGKEVASDVNDEIKRIEARKTRFTKGGGR